MKKKIHCHRTALFSLILLASVLCSGCGDPMTESRISNDTPITIEVELVLDQQQWNHGFEPKEYQQWLAGRTDEWKREQLQAYVERPGLRERGKGVKLVSVDTARMAGSYQISPSGFMIVNAGMGTSYYNNFRAFTHGHRHKL